MPRQFDAVAKDLKHGLYFIIFCLLAAFCISYSVSVSGAVITPGTVVVQGSPKKVQHLTGGKIIKIYVEEGDHVEKDQLLLKLDDVAVKSKLFTLQTDLKSSVEQIANKRRQKIVVDKELEVNEDLFAKKLSTISAVNRLRSRSLELEGEIEKLISLTKSLQDQIIPAKEMLEATEVKAPISGIVHQLSVHTIGGVIGPQDQIMTIIPSDDNLVVETRIRPEDIDQVYPNQPVRLKFTAFNQKTTPEMQGSLQRISPDVVVDRNTNTSYYVGRVLISDQRAQSLKIVAGMNVEAFIQTHDRTILSYLMKPVTDQMFKSIRER